MKNRASYLTLPKQRNEHRESAAIKAHYFMLLIRIVFILLFAYSGMVKVASFDIFKIQLHRQPFPEEMSNILVWALPIGELLVALFIALPQTWKKGLQAAFGLMVAFTIYTGLAASGIFGYVPCACGGFIQGFTWWQHLLFNTALTGILGIGLLKLNKINKMRYEQKSK